MRKYEPRTIRPTNANALVKRFQGLVVNARALREFALTGSHEDLVSFASWNDSNGEFGEMLSWDLRVMVDEMADDIEHDAALERDDVDIPRPCAECGGTASRDWCSSCDGTGVAA